jgi:ASF1 like histone chaperone
MTAISVTNVNVLDNPTKVTNPLQLEIQYECLYALDDGKAFALLQPCHFHGLLTYCQPLNQTWNGNSPM